MGSRDVTMDGRPPAVRREPTENEAWNSRQCKLVHDAGPGPGRPGRGGAGQEGGADDRAGRWLLVPWDVAGLVALPAYSPVTSCTFNMYSCFHIIKPQ